MFFYWPLEEKKQNQETFQIKVMPMDQFQLLSVPPNYFIKMSKEQSIVII